MRLHAYETPPRGDFSKDWRASSRRSGSLKASRNKTKTKISPCTNRNKPYQKLIISEKMRTENCEYTETLSILEGETKKIDKSYLSLNMATLKIHSVTSAFTIGVSIFVHKYRFEI